MIVVIYYYQFCFQRATRENTFHINWCHPLKIKVIYIIPLCLRYGRQTRYKSLVQFQVAYLLRPAASFPVVLGDFGCDVTCQACRENSPRTPRAIALGSKPPLVTRIARTGLGTRLCGPHRAATCFCLESA